MGLANVVARIERNPNVVGFRALGTEINAPAIAFMQDEFSHLNIDQAFGALSSKEPTEYRVSHVHFGNLKSDDGIVPFFAGVSKFHYSPTEFLLIASGVPQKRDFGGRHSITEYFTHHGNHAKLRDDGLLELCPYLPTREENGHIFLGNRGIYLTLNEDHPNHLSPHNYPTIAADLATLLVEKEVTPQQAKLVVALGGLAVKAKYAIQ